jgi:lipopolysaccharide cholinephosphotransferase
VSEIFDLKDANLKSIKKLQQKSLEVFLYFKNFCEEHNLLFYFCGGCCIGAIRHKGFIPWDDDIDVFMPRDDYEKFQILWEKYGDKEKYYYCKTSRDINYHHTASTFKDLNTTFINRHSRNEDIIHGLGIDIIPIDGYPNSKVKRINQVFFSIIYSLFNAQRLPDNQGKAIRWLSKIILSLIRSKELRYRTWSYAEKQMSQYSIEDCDYITELVTGLRYMKLKYPKEIFEEATYKEFEGYQLPIPKGYEIYLKMAFGDYMQLPPEEDRVPKHDTVYINLNESYKKFKGIYYCVDEKDVKKDEQ